MSKLAFIKDFEKLLQTYVNLPDGQLEKLVLSKNEDLLFVVFKGDYIKVINIALDSNWAILKDFIKQINEARELDTVTMKQYLEEEK